MRSSLNAREVLQQCVPGIQWLGNNCDLRQDIKGTKNAKQKAFRVIVHSGGQQKSVGTFVFEISFYRQYIMAAKQARYLYYYHVHLVCYLLIAIGYERRTSVCWTPFLGWSNAARLDAFTHWSLARDWSARFRYIATNISSFCLLSSQCMFMIPRHLCPPVLAQSLLMVSSSLPVSTSLSTLHPSSIRVFMFLSNDAYLAKCLQDLISTASILLLSVIPCKRLIAIF